MVELLPVLQARTAEGNEKTGRRIHNFSMTPGASCPGASAWCASACYAKRPYHRWKKQVGDTWDENFEATQAGVMPEIPKGAKAFRIHVSGDFYSVAYTAAWIAIIKSRPEVKFWAYTRSWRVPELKKVLQKLHDLPNMQLFASIDWTMGEQPPAGWRVARIKGDDRFTGYACPEQDGRKPNCESCGYCFKGQRGNVTFKVH